MMEKEKRKMQNVSFKKLEDFYDYIEGEERKIVLLLRSLIYENIPEVKEKLSYQVPFFYKRKRICFIWPGSITWGNVSQGAVRLGFANGHLMGDQWRGLKLEGRKQVAWIEFTKEQEINTEEIRSMLILADLLDKENP